MEVIMDTKEQLYAEHAKWTVKYVQAHDLVSDMLKRCFEEREGEKLPVWTMTKESFAALNSAIENEGIALDKLRDTARKLQGLSQSE